MINEISEQIHAMDNLKGMQVESHVGQQKETAQFDVIVKRMSANIDKALPFILFARQFMTSGYVDVMSIPSGMTLEVRNGINQGTVSEPANYCFTDLVFTDGANTDIIRIQSSASSAYPAILEATLGDVFQVGKIRLQLSDKDRTDQFNVGLNVISHSIFGKGSQNPISMGSALAPNQTQPHVIDLSVSFPVDKEVGLISKMLPVANLSLTFSISVARIRKHNRGALKF